MIQALICFAFHRRYHFYYEKEKLCTKCDQMRGPKIPSGFGLKVRLFDQGMPA